MIHSEFTVSLPDIRGLRLWVPDILSITVKRDKEINVGRDPPLEPGERGLSVAGTVGLTRPWAAGAQVRLQGGQDVVGSRVTQI